MRLAYSTDASVYQELPLAVCIPQQIQDLKTLIRFANENQITLIPRTAGTSLAGQEVGAGNVIDISRFFNQRVGIDQKEEWATVHPGVIRDELKGYLRPLGLMFGRETSPASRAMSGGMIASNSTGLHSIVCGDTRHNLLEATVILDDESEVPFKELNEAAYFEKLSLKSREGDIYRNLNALLTNKENQEAIHAGYPKSEITRRNTGYALDMLSDTSQPFNLCRLLAGSEGTIGIITEAKIKLMPLPAKEIGLLCVHFNDMVECMRGNVIALNNKPEASELVDKY